MKEAQITARSHTAQGEDIGERRAQIGRRLREERERLGISSRQLAIETGVSRNTQIRYEGGRRAAGADYLAALDVIGINLAYVLTGVRPQGESPRDLARFLFNWAIDHPDHARTLVEQLRTDPKAKSISHLPGSGQ